MEPTPESRLTTSRAELVRFAQRDLAAGARPADVLEMLTKNGMSAEDARAIVGDIGGQLNAGAMAQILLGAVLTAAGIGLSVMSVVMGSRGILFYGLVGVGLFTIARGTLRLLG